MCDRPETTDRISTANSPTTSSTENLVPATEVTEDTEKTDQTVCDTCKEQNLIQNVNIQSCHSCSSPYCVHFASSVDPIHCALCLHNVSVTEEIVIKKSEHYDEDKDITYTRTRKARSIKLSGLDWLFHQRKIRSYSDAELEVAIEYHRATFNGMVYEREQRRVEYFHRNAGKSVKINTSTTSLDGVTTSETVKVKKTKTTTVKKPVAGEINLQAMMEQMLKSGLTPEQLMKMVGKK